MESSLCCKIQENTRTFKYLEKAWIHILVSGWRTERDKRFTCRPENLPGGQLPINSSPGQIGSQVNNWWIQARLTKCGGLSHKFKSGIQHWSLSAHIYCRGLIKGRKSARLCYFCSNWATHTKAGNSSSGRPYQSLVLSDFWGKPAAVMHVTLWGGSNNSQPR